VVVLDVWYIGLRTIFHTKADYDYLIKSITVLCTLLTFYDLLEIWSKGSKYTIKEAEVKGNAQNVKRNQVLPENDVAVIDLAKSKNGSKSGKKVMKMVGEVKNGVRRAQIKEIDAQKMVIKFRENLTIYKFCTKELKKEKNYSQNTLILVNNYIYLLRVLALHLVFIALPHAAYVQSIALLAIEIAYFLNLSIRYFKKKHLRSVRFFIPKVVQSIFLLSI
jgi:hypothetical protein